MIGLGSNRLTCCRRGGMGIANIGGGGMWVERSPYSAQATAALKAQFPTQWPTIRDYGFAHPEIVPFINEDPMLVMSLIEGLGIRRLIPASGAYVKTTVIATTAKLSFDCVADIRGMTGYPATLFGVINSYSGGSGMYGFINHGTGGNAFRYGAYNSNYVASGVADNTDNVHLEGIVGDSTIELKVNGESKGTASKGTPDNTAIFIFGANCRQMGGFYGGNTSRLGSLRLYTPSGDEGWFVPFIRNNAAECLDLVSGNLCEKVGSFTISESPAS